MAPWAMVLPGTCSSSSTGMGDSQIGAYRFSNWTLYVAFITAFSSF
jgi:hypothetical protein